jgi:hypothetical protein
MPRYAALEGPRWDPASRHEIAISVNARIRPVLKASRAHLLDQSRSGWGQLTFGACHTEKLQHGLYCRGDGEEILKEWPNDRITSQGMGVWVYL